MTKRNKILLGLLVTFVGMQAIRPSRQVPTADPHKDFLNNGAISFEVKSLIKNKCYDCHSYDTQYPWYSEIAPVSWWINNHVKHGRKHLNFAEWTTYTDDDKRHVLEECLETIGKNEMPMKSYLYMHPEAKFNYEQKAAVVGFLKERLAQMAKE
jgi:predicted Fe-S protein YdhL (DUF1289 family)